MRKHGKVTEGQYFLVAAPGEKSSFIPGVADQGVVGEWCILSQSHAFLLSSI